MSPAIAELLSVNQKQPLISIYLSWRGLPTSPKCASEFALGGPFGSKIPAAVFFSSSNGLIRIRSCNGSIFLMSSAAFSAVSAAHMCIGLRAINRALCWWLLLMRAEALCCAALKAMSCYTTRTSGQASCDKFQ
eukprot:GHRR01014062.1.p1 GENE.GHRR01014062.1~~GHRR01014062.1.p1  ORF type:complete len:134 (-),score=21.55 GHRR01014062.1:143-544(-)